MVDINDLEQEVLKTLDENPNDTVELIDLRENTYNLLKKRFNENYDVGGIITIFNTSSEKRRYTLHLRRRNENA